MGYAGSTEQISNYRDGSRMESGADRAGSDGREMWGIKGARMNRGTRLLGVPAVTYRRGVAEKECNYGDSSWLFPREGSLESGAVPFVPLISFGSRDPLARSTLLFLPCKLLERRPRRGRRANAPCLPGQVSYTRN